MTKTADLIHQYNEWVDSASDRTPEAFERWLAERAVLEAARDWAEEHKKDTTDTGLDLLVSLGNLKEFQ